MSTYSPDLRIELITTGDQAGTWGNTTNTNLSNVIEQAIAGYVSVSVTSANQAFTYLNGGSTTAALNQSVFAAIALTTTTAANFNVYAPPSSKQYTIYNASAYTATLYNSTVIGNTTAAGTGAIIPAGKTVTVWSDGTNFSFQNNHLSSLTLATDLPIAEGGTGASTASAARTNFGATTIGSNLFTLADPSAVTFPRFNADNTVSALDAATFRTAIGASSTTGTVTSVAATVPAFLSVAGSPITSSGTLAISLSGTALPVANGGTGVTTSTGTGSVVLSDSPTLVTPALGTPASGTLTNCTFPTLNQNTTGTAAGLSATLAVASGGTGVTTSTGTGSVVLSTSPTLVTPALGTPSSGTLTNCTFPTLNQNTTGTAAGLSATLAVASGGTGVTTSTGTGNVVLSTSPTLTTPTLTGFTETVFAITDSGSVDINPANGTIQTWTLGASRTPTATSFANGQSVTLMIADGAAYSVNWTTINVNWVGGVVPLLPTSGHAVIVLWKVAGTVYGNFVGSTS
jgi:hypothetical protein